MARKRKSAPDWGGGWEKTRFIRFTHLLITVIAIGLGAFFTYLQIKDLRADKIVTPLLADILWRGSLVIYYWCWIAGTRFDTNNQELTYVSFPGKGKWPAQAFGALILFVLVASVLLWAQGDMQHFALALTAFFIVDHALWRYLIYFLRPSTRESRMLFQKERRYYDLEMLNTVVNQVQGNWKWKRNIAGAVIVVIINFFAFSTPIRNLAVSAILLGAPWLSEQEASAVAYAALVFLFVAVMEIWHWLMRLFTAVRLRVLEALKKRYDIVPR